MTRFLHSTAFAFIIAGWLATCPAISWAQTDSPFCRPGYTVGFFNGVFNSRDDALEALKKVAVIGGSTWHDQPIEYKLFYNQSGRNPDRTEATLFEDLAEVMQQKDTELNGLLKGRWELFWQALRGNSPDWSRIRAAIAAADSLFDTLVANLANKIAAGYAWWFSNPPTAADTAAHVAQLQLEIANGRKLLLVAHSQGNLFVNTAYDAVMPKTTPQAMKVVHVAAASSTQRGPYTTATIDVIIAAMRSLIAGGAALAPNWTVPASHLLVDKTGHTFLGTYLNSSLTSAGKIENEIKLALDTLEDPPLDATRYTRYDALLSYFVPKGTLAERPGAELDPDPRNWTYIDGPWNMSPTDRQLLLQEHAQGFHFTRSIGAAGESGLYLPSLKTSRWCGKRTINQWGSTIDDQALSLYRANRDQAFDAVISLDPNRTKLGYADAGVNAVLGYLGFSASQVVQQTNMMTNASGYTRFVAQPENATHEGIAYEPLVPDLYYGMAVLSVVIDRKRQ